VTETDKKCDVEVERCWCDPASQLAGTVPLAIGAFSEYVQNTNSVIAYRRTGMCFDGVTCRGRSAGDAGGRPVCLRGMMNLDRHRCRPLCFQPRQSLIR